MKKRLLQDRIRETFGGLLRLNKKGRKCPGKRPKKRPGKRLRKRYVLEAFSSL
jgi:hypothetical protein